MNRARDLQRELTELVEEALRQFEAGMAVDVEDRISRIAREYGR
jgi:hypothetical protein